MAKERAERLMKQAVLIPGVSTDKEWRQGWTCRSSMIPTTPSARAWARAVAAGMKSYMDNTSRSRVSYACLPIRRSSTSSGPSEPSFGPGTPSATGSRGVSSIARDSGLLIEVSRGLFQLREAAGIDQIDFVVVCARAPRAWSVWAPLSPIGI